MVNQLTGKRRRKALNDIVPINTAASTAVFGDMAPEPRGMKLAAGDTLSNIYLLDNESEQTIEVKGKEVVLNRLRIGNRDTKGTKR